jgi:hypothetical protein
MKASAISIHQQPGLPFLQDLQLPQQLFFLFVTGS